jgi:AcrR family transcriptional regulator
MAVEPAVTVRPRDTILRAATKLFGQRSYPGTTMRDIATEVGILAGSLYAHISSKEALLVEIIDDGIGHFITDVRKAAADAGPEPDLKIRAMVAAHVAVVAANPERTLIVFHQWRYLGEDQQKKVRQRRRVFEGLFKKVIEEGVAAGIFADSIDTRVARLTILGALNWTPEWLSPDGPEKPAEVADHISDVLLAGLHGGAPGRRRTPKRS